MADEAFRLPARLWRGEGADGAVRGRHGVGGDPVIRVRDSVAGADGTTARWWPAVRAPTPPPRRVAAPAQPRRRQPLKCQHRHITGTVRALRMPASSTPRQGSARHGRRTGLHEHRPSRRHPFRGRPHSARHHMRIGAQQPAPTGQPLPGAADTHWPSAAQATSQPPLPPLDGPSTSRSRRNAPWLRSWRSSPRPRCSRPRRTGPAARPPPTRPARRQPPAPVGRINHRQRRIQLQPP